MAEEQKNKYLDLYAILPSEVSLQLAEGALDLGTIHNQVKLQKPLFFRLNALVCKSLIFIIMSSWKQLKTDQYKTIILN